jgi:hypothetical protein
LQVVSGHVRELFQFCVESRQVAGLLDALLRVPFALRNVEMDAHPNALVATSGHRNATAEHDVLLAGRSAQAILVIPEIARPHTRFPICYHLRAVGLIQQKRPPHPAALLHVGTERLEE